MIAFIWSSESLDHALKSEFVSENVGDDAPRQRRQPLLIQRGDEQMRRHDGGDAGLNRCRKRQELDGPQSVWGMFDKG